jgi:predicted nucleotidyltransferase
MGLSKRYLSENHEGVRFNPDRLATILQERLPEAVFCLLLGSAARGAIAPGSDIDLAFFLDGKPSLSFYTKAADAVAELLPAVRSDIGILNHSEPVYRYEALKGRLLFVRDRERYHAFFSLACREYESQMISYQRQWKYRLEAAHAL